MIGRKFNRWTVVSEIKERKANGHIMWVCKCDCGKQKKVSGGALKQARSQSCGCIQKEKVRKLNTTHGMGHTNIYVIWKGMKGRCYNLMNTSYKHYGAKGITVCDRWMNSFENFFLDMGLPDDNMSIERKDSTGNYEPSNCKWATRKEQMRNTKRSRIIEFNGESKTLVEWSEILKIKYGTLRGRLERWTVEKAFTTPIQ